MKILLAFQLFICLFLSHLNAEATSLDSLLIEAEYAAHYKLAEGGGQEILAQIQGVLNKQIVRDSFIQIRVYSLQALLSIADDQFDESLKWINKIEQFLPKDVAKAPRNYCYFYVINSVYYRKKGMHETALIYLQKAESIFSDHEVNDVFAKAAYANSFGDYSMALENYDLAANYFIQYGDVLKDHFNDRKETARLYYENKAAVGGLYLALGKVAEAKAIYLNVLNLFPKEKFSLLYINIMSNFAYALHDLGDAQKAIEIYIELNEISEEKDNILRYNNIGSIYGDLNQNEKAKEYFFKALEIGDKYKEDADQSMYSYAAQNLSSILFKNDGNSIKALHYINKAVDSALKVYGKGISATNYMIAQKGRILFSLDKKDEAVTALNISLSNLKIDLDDPTTYKNKQSALGISKILLEHSRAYYEAYFRFKNIDDLERSKSISEKNIALLNLARESLNSDDSKSAIMNGSRNVFYTQVNIFYELYKVTNNKMYVEKAFELVERTNNILLLESILKDGTANKLGIPKDLFEKEQQLKTDFKGANSTFLQFAESEKPDSSAIAKAKTTLDNCKKSYLDFKTKLEKDYPKYFKLNYSDEVVTVQKLQNSTLSNDQSLISYFISDEDIYGMLVSKNGLEFHKVGKKEAVIKTVKELRKQILDFDELNTNYDISKLNESSVELYNFLIKPFESEITEKVVIIPMAELSFIPFDILLRSKPSKDLDLRDYPYLIQDHVISYGYSATLISEQVNYSNNTDSKKQFAGFAPRFNSTIIASNRSELVSLVHNRSEVETINEMLGGDLYLDGDASRENFIAKCDEYNVLHLATHGVSNVKDGEFSYLAFTNDQVDEKKGLLYATDIYDLRLNADLVVLSACETAMGELQSGEGVISLARAFIYAGAKSTVTTLWQVNDAAASQMMKYFYSELSKGLPKDVALRNTKLDFINSNPDEQIHPFYWSSFIPIGVMDPVELSSPNIMKYVLIGIGGIVLLVLGGLLIRRQIA